MNTPRNYLAIDLGASSGRAVLGRWDGRRVGLTEIHRFPNGPLHLNDGLYWNAPGLFGEILAAIGKVAPSGAGNVHGLGVDTWGVDFALVSAQGELLGLPRHYRDPRTNGTFSEAFKRVPRAQIYARTGIQFMEINTVYQLLALRRAHPELLELADRLLFMPDLMNYWLCGEPCSDASIASTSQLFDSAAGEWAGELVRALDLPERILPRVLPPGTRIGPLRRALCAELGLTRAPQLLLPAGHDTACAVAAVPATSDDWAYISCGTWSLVGFELSVPIRSTAALDANVTNEVGAAGTIRFLRNMTGLWLLQECQRHWATEGSALTHEELQQAAAHVASSKCWIDPDDARFSSPGDMPARIAAFCVESDQPPPSSPGEFARCVLESLALKTRVVLDRLEPIAGRRARRVHVVGGGSRNELLMQCIADATQRQVLAGPVEATALGNVLLQALAAGELSTLSELRRAVVNSVELRSYEPRDSAAWLDKLDRFARLARRS